MASGRGGGRLGWLVRVKWVENCWSSEAMVADICQTPPTEPLLGIGAMLGTGDISEPHRQIPACRSFMFQKEETEVRTMGGVGCLKVYVREKMKQKSYRCAEGHGWVSILNKEGGKAHYGRDFPAKGTPSAKALRQECAWHAWRRARRCRLKRAKEEEKENGLRQALSGLGVFF